MSRPGSHHAEWILEQHVALRLAGQGTEQGVRNALERMVAQGLLHRTTAGAAYLYRLNRKHLAAPHVEGLARLRDELFERWRAQIQTWPVTPHVVLLFGSVARQAMDADSDIDLLVVTNDDARDLLEDDIARLQEDTTTWTGNDARVLHVSASQVSTDETVLVDAARDGVVITGDLAWLRNRLHNGSAGSGP